MKTFEIYFSDLSPEAQDELLRVAGVHSPAEMNWDFEIDILPLATYEEEEE